MKLMQNVYRACLGAALEDYPSARIRKVPPLYQIKMDSFSSSIESIEGYNHAVQVVLVDNHCQSVRVSMDLWNENQG